MAAAAPEFAEAMQRVARLRRCPACRQIIAPEDQLCPGCERLVVCPHADAWPRHVKRHQQVLLIARHTRGLRTDAGEISDAGWRSLLLSNYRGEWVGEGASRRLIPFFGADVNDVYLYALAAADRWARAQGA